MKKEMMPKAGKSVYSIPIRLIFGVRPARKASRLDPIECPQRVVPCLAMWLVLHFKCLPRTSFAGSKFPTLALVFNHLSGPQMKKLFVLSAALFIFTTLCFGQDAEWKEFVSQKSKFAINFPATPKESETKTVDGNGNRYLFSVSLPQPFLSVQVSDLPKTSAPMEDPALSLFYVYARNGSLNGLKGSKLISENDIRLNGLLGREYRIANDDSFLIRRVFINNDRLYQVTISVPKALEKDKEIEKAAAKLFNSFRLM